MTLISLCLNLQHYKYKVKNNSQILICNDLDFNVGQHNGLPISFTNNLWSTTIDYPFSYEITPAPLTVIANDASRQYGEENPEFSCSFFGFKNGETKDVLKTQPTIETTAVQSSNVGTYPIIPYGAEAQNYTFTYERGTLTITKADQEIFWNQEFNDAKVGDIIELTAESTSGLTIKYTTTDESIAEIFTQNGNKCVEFLKAGTVSIRATQEGNENYNEADRVSKSVTVSTPAVEAEELILSHEAVELEEQATHQLTATVNPDHTTDKTVTWTSSNPEIAHVSDSGLITAKSAGKATVTATCGQVSAICEVTVKAASGIEEIMADENAVIDIYSIAGVPVKIGARKSDLKSLPAGIYIILSDGKAYKVKL